MKPDPKRTGLAGKVVVAAVIAAALSGCGQKGPLTLPGDSLEPTDAEIPIGDETGDDEDQNED
jgi:predicted small lipoprotein YifL